MTDVAPAPDPVDVDAGGAPPEDVRHDEVVFVTPWYPTEANPMWGSFVRDAVTTLQRHWTEPVTVIHVDGNPRTEEEERGEHAQEPSWSWIEERPEARVIRVRAPMDPMTPRHEAIDIQREALMLHVRDHLRAASFVNAHVGAPTGAAVAPLLTPRSRFVITEHATYVRAVFKDMQAATDYRAAVARAQNVIAVGDESAGVLRRLCPQQSEIIRAVPNPVRIDAVPLKDEPMRRPDRWVYVGSLIERKGVDTLLESFALAVERDPSRPWHLTLVGDGPLREQLEARVAELGFGERVTFVGTVPPEEVGGYLRAADVLVHLSAYETFGITIIEAAAAGLPVVVTRCGGPEETMALPEDVGLCTFVPRTPTPEQVVDAVESLRRDMTHAEIAQVRQVLRGFYGEDRVADLLRTYLLGRPPEEPLARPGGLGIVVVFQGLTLWRRLMHGIQRAIDMGAEVVAVDLESMSSGVVPPGMTLIPVGDVNRHNPLLRVERTIVDRAPRAVLRGAGRLAAKLPEERRVKADRLLADAGSFHARVSGFSERQIYRRPWLLVRGLVMARRAESQPELYTADHIDVIVHGGTRFTQLTYRLLKKHPEATYHSGPFTAKHVGRWWGEALRRREAAGTTPSDRTGTTGGAA